VNCVTCFSVWFSAVIVSDSFYYLLPSPESRYTDTRFSCFSVLPRNLNLFSNQNHGNSDISDWKETKEGGNIRQQGLELGEPGLL